MTSVQEKHCARTTAARMATVACTLLFATIFAAPAHAQFGPAAGAAQGSQAAQLPLSGRTGQSGGVTATQAPIPGTTTSVNTLNPTVQVSGTFAESADSTAKMPFSGKLSLREAVARGLDYNLGAVGLAQAVRQAHGQTRVARSALLPNVTGDLAETRDRESPGFGRSLQRPRILHSSRRRTIQLHGPARPVIADGCRPDGAEQLSVFERDPRGRISYRRRTPGTSSSSP